MDELFEFDDGVDYLSFDVDGRVYFSTYRDGVEALTEEQTRKLYEAMKSYYEGKDHV